MRTETVEVDECFGEDYKGNYVFEEISWAKRNRIIDRHTKYHPFTGQVVSTDTIAIQAETIWAALKQQPAHKPLSLEKLLSEDIGIPIELGELFSKVVNDLCGLTAQAQRFLSALYEEGKPIQNSQSSVCAKSLGGHPTSLKSSQPKPSKSSS